MSNKLKAVIGRERRQLRPADRLERKIHALLNLRDDKPYSGDGGGLTRRNAPCQETGVA
jgi:hypothetical protein